MSDIKIVSTPEPISHNCVYFSNYHCKRYAPIADTRDPSGYGLWPRVCATDSCGEFVFNHKEK